MKTLNAYIAKSLFLTTLISVGLLTFVMLSGRLFRLFDLISRGVPPALLAKFLLYLTPDVFRFTIPMSILVSTVLVFSRMSSDNEITAMKASGISLWQIISPALVLSVALSGVCFWLNTTVAPRFRYRAELLKREGAAANPLVFLQPGGFSGDLPGYSIRVGRRKGDDLYDIHIYVLGGKDRALRQDITARRGKIHIDAKKRVIRLTLKDVTYASVNLSGKKDANAQVNRLASKEFVFPLRYGAAIDSKPLQRRLKFMDLPMLFARIYVDSEAGKDTTRQYTEMNQRMSMALSPLAFLLIGIPFGIRSRRSETSVGLLLCVLLALGFYAFMMLSSSIQTQHRLHPELLVWVPNILYQVGGLWALIVIGRH